MQLANPNPTLTLTLTITQPYPYPYPYPCTLTQAGSGAEPGRTPWREQQRQCLASLHVRTKHPFKNLVSFL